MSQPVPPQQNAVKSDRSASYNALREKDPSPRHSARERASHGPDATLGQMSSLRGKHSVKGSKSGALQQVAQNNSRYEPVKHQSNPYPLPVRSEEQVAMLERLRYEKEQCDRALSEEKHRNIDLLSKAQNQDT